MQIRRTAVQAAAVGFAAALVVSACAADDDGDGEAAPETPEEAEEVVSGGEFTIQIVEPQNLMVGHSTEVNGAAVLEQLYDGLTQIDYDTGEVMGLVATDWESDDAVTWTFHLRDDYTFHNGEPVTAQTFVDTWNWVVNPDNAQQNANFHDKFVGYDEVVAGDADTMSGVRAIDDYTLEIELTEPFSPLPAILTYTGFYPLPPEALDDIEAFQEAPIGNGRYMMDGVWEHDVQIAIVRYPDYPGESGVADRIVWRIYADLNTAYLDVQAGELDILSGIPPERLTTVESDFGANVVESASSSFNYIGFPLYLEEFQDADVRHALSLAIDREAIVQAIFAGARLPATAFIPPVLGQHREDACEYCHYDPETAAQLYEDAGGPSELTLWFNTGGGHEEWAEAVANMWQEHLPIETVSFESLEFAQYLDLHDNAEVTGPFRLGWALAYPSPQYAMEPIYTTGQSSNYTHYSNEEFDNLIRQANGTPDLAEADSLYQQAEDILLEDMPVIPMFYEVRHTVHTDRVSNIEVDPRTFVRVEQIQVND